MGEDKQPQRNIIVIVLAVYMIVLMLTALIGCFSSETVAVVTEIATGNGGDTCAANAASSMISVGGFIIGIAGTLFDLTVTRTVVNMGQYIGQGGLFAEPIRVAWQIFRDLANLALIAGLVWAAFSLILRINLGGQNPGRLVVNILIVALLINFSYFFAGAIIDASNFSSKLIYEQAVTGGVSTDRGSGGVVEVFSASYGTGVSISERFMAATRLGSIHDFGKIVQNGGDINSLNVLVLALAGALLFGGAAAVFFYVTSLFLKRFVAIIILLFLSPIGMLRFTSLPKFADWGKQWWKSLFAQAIFPPVFFLLIAISLRIISTQGAHAETALGISGGSLAGLLSASAGEIGSSPFSAALEVILVYVVALGLLIASAKIAIGISQELEVKLPTSKSIYDYALPSKQIFGLGKQIGSFGTKRFDVPLTDGKYGASIFDLASLGTIPLARRGLRATGRGISDRWSTRKSFITEEGEKLRDLKQKREERARNALDAYKASPTDEDRRKELEAEAKKMPADELIEWARRLSTEDREALKEAVPEQREAIEKAIKERGTVSNQGGGTTAGGEGKTDDPNKKTNEQILTEIQALRSQEGADSAREAREYFKEHATKLRAMSAQKESARDLVAAIRESGHRPGDVLPAEAIVGNETIIRELDDSDITVIKGRKDISDEDYLLVKGAHDTAKDRGFTPPAISDISRPPVEEGGEEST